MSSENETVPLVEVVRYGEIERKTLWIWRWTPVEILVILHTFACVALIPVQNYYVIDEIAKSHGQSHIIRHAEQSCNQTNESNVTHANDTSVMIQKEATDLIMKLGLCSTLGSVIPIFLFGYLSDFVGRRMMYIISVLGTIVKEAILLLTVTLGLPLWVLYIGQVIFAFTGTYGGSLVQIFATVSDLTSPGKNRAFRITVVQATGMLTAAVTNFVMGYWVWTENFYEPIIMTICISSLTLLLSVFILRNFRAPVSQPRTFIGPLKLFCRDTPQHRRRNLLLCLFIFLLSSFCLMGKLEYQTLFLMHKPICWNEFDIQVMHAVQTLVNTVCVVGMVRLFLYLANDFMILIFGSLSGVISMLILTFSVKSWMVYLHVLFGFVSIAVFPVLRAMMSRLVDQQEQGFLFASIAGLDELSGAFSGLVNGKLYGWSVGWFPGLIFILMSVIFSVCLVGSLILYKLMKSHPTAEVYGNKEQCSAT